MKNFVFIVCALFSATMYSQVGVNTLTPQSTLDVVGDVKLSGSLFLEDPGSKAEIRNSKLLIQSTTNIIEQYDIEISKYGPINYAELVFKNLSKFGLQDYDTKISTTDYIVTIQGYYFLEPTADDTDVLSLSLLDTDNIEGYQIYAYKNIITGTWFLRAFVNNSIFRTRESGDPFFDTEIDLYLNLIIYRNGFISKSHPKMTVNMGNNETKKVVLPTGF